VKRKGVRGPYRWLSPSERERVVARIRAGDRIVEVMAAFGLPSSTVYRIADQAVLARRRVAHSPHRLSWEERERISRGVAAGESGRAIARALGRSASTVCREIGACGGRERYRAVRGERRCEQQARRPKPTKLSGCPRLLAAVEAALLEGWSPQQISARLKADHPDDGEMRISHETIYQSRDDLPVAVCPVSRGAAPRIGGVSADRADQASRAGRCSAARADPGHDRDLAAPSGGRRSRGAGALGGRSDRREGRSVVRRDPARGECRRNRVSVAERTSHAHENS